MSEENVKETKEGMLTVNQLLHEVSFVYVNTSAVQGSNWDIRIAFGDRGPTKQIEPKAGIILSHQHAKALLKSLEGIVKITEEKFGEIRLPQGTLLEPEIKQE